MDRKKKLYLNTFTALLLQLVTFVCGFILPKYILLYFGSDVNGLVTSVTRFLSVITFLEMGVGPVIQSNLYGPLARGDWEQTSRIVVSAERFYKRIACIFLGYVVLLFFVYPELNREFDFLYTASLTVIIALSSFAQYYFGITYQVFLNADQKIYVCSLIQIVTVVLNTAVCIGLMCAGCSIHVVKLASSLVFILRPFCFNLYVRKNYSLNRKITYTEEPIRQKWNGFAQHIAAVVSEEIDVILLTVFGSYQSVSIYSVYFLVVNGITRILMNAVSGLEAFWGNMLARGEKALLLRTFDTVECLIHGGVSFLYSAAAVLIAPFVSVYIRGTADSAAYNLPLFGALLTFAYGMQCLRIPYFRVIKAAGHYKQTQNGSFASAAINAGVSLVLVMNFGLIGVSVGTLLAMAFHTVYLAIYLRRHILNRPIRHFLCHLAADVLVLGLTLYLTQRFEMTDSGYGGWILYALKVSLTALGITLAVNGIFYPSRICSSVRKVVKRNGMQHRK